MSTLNSRLARIEKALADPAERREYSWYQLLQLADGATLEEVGPPEHVVKPGKKSIEEMLEEAYEQERRLAAAAGDGEGQIG